MSMFTPNRHHQTALIAVCVVLSWLGEYVHNVIDLPQLTILSPENSIPALVSIGLFVAWWLLPRKHLPAMLLLLWALLNLIGGAIISVMPFPFLPFYPEQSLKHYAAHVLYGLTQLPLIVIMLRQLWRRH